ncbi:MAG: cytochrome P450 [Actinomycetota bacterium]|nr:cytochrome P450 [Actinomycetota bacterium]
MRPALPPGPRLPKSLQLLGWWTRPIPFFERCRARFGKRFTIRRVGNPPLVMLADPDWAKELFTAPPDAVHPGEGARILEPLVGSNSVFLLDERPHLEQRKLMLPAFHGENMQRLEGVMTEVAEREVASWQRDRPMALHRALQGLTLKVILRAVFGVERGERFDALHERLTSLLELVARGIAMLPFLQHDFGGRGPYARFVRLREEIDVLLYELIDELRDEAGRSDVLTMLLAARHEDGSPMSAQDLRDELMTLLVAGHETTASELAWVFERLVREPRVLSRLVEEIDGGDGDAYLTATVQETLRRRPVLTNAVPRLVKKQFEIGGWTYPADTHVTANAYLIHHDPANYPDPYAFRPERFLEHGPGTYTWLPFGGGRRRCLGANFAILEMKIVLRAVLSRARIEAAHGGPELSRRRSLTLSPREGAHVVLRDRDRAGEPEARVALDAR